MKVIYHSKRTKRSVYLKDNGVVVKTGIQAIGSQEADIQRRAHSIGIAPKVFTANKDSIEMESTGVRGNMDKEPWLIRAKGCRPRFVCRECQDAEKTARDKKPA